MKATTHLILFTLFCTSCTQLEKKEVAYSSTPVTSGVLFAPGIISTEDNEEFHICFSPDGESAYFSRRIGEDPQKIYQTNFENGNWTAPVLAPFSTDRDETPYITPDGQYFYFG